MAILKKKLAADLVDHVAARARARDDGGVGVLVQQPLDVEGLRHLFGPSHVAFQQLLAQLPLGGNVVPEDVQLLLKGLRLTAHLLSELDGLDVLPPGRTELATLGLRVHHRKLVEVAKEHHRFGDFQKQFHEEKRVFHLVAASKGHTKARDYEGLGFGPWP